MRNYNFKKNFFVRPTVNVEGLWNMVGDEAKAQASTSKAPVIDCTANGVFKVLGKGDMPQQALIVKARYFTRLAEIKIKQAGGACILTA